MSQEDRTGTATEACRSNEYQDLRYRKTLIHLFPSSKTYSIRVPFSFSSREKCTPINFRLRYKKKSATCRSLLRDSNQRTRCLSHLYLSISKVYKADSANCTSQLSTSIHVDIIRYFSSREHQSRRREKHPKQQQPWRHFQRRWCPASLPLPPPRDPTGQCSPRGW